MASVAIAVLLVVAAGVSPVALDHRGDIVYEEHTAHQHLEIVDNGDERTMYLDGSRHSATDLRSGSPRLHVYAVLSPLDARG